MLTAGITAAVAGLLSLFGIKPGPYLVVVAIVIKIAIVGLSLTFGARWWKQRSTPTPPTGSTDVPTPPADNHAGT